MKLEDKLFLNQYKTDSEPHLKIKIEDLCVECKHKQCTFVCPAGVYKWDEDNQKIILGWENCIEMGACVVACNEFDNVEMRYPKGGFGISYKYG